MKRPNSLRIKEAFMRKGKKSKAFAKATALALSATMVVGGMTYANPMTAGATELVAMDAVDVLADEAATEGFVTTSSEEYSDRAVVAMDLAGKDGGETYLTATDAEGNEYTKGVYMSWRSYEADFDDNNNITTTFTVYKNGEVLAQNLKVTNLLDPEGSAADTYKVVGSNDEALELVAKDIKPWTDKYLELNLSAPADQTMPDNSVATYHANDMSLGDLDGDGVLDLIVKWYPNNAQDNSKSGYTGTTILDGYKIDYNTGDTSLLWRIDMGVNIRSGAHYTQFQVWDYDGDGKAEIAVRTSEGTTAYASEDGTAATLKETGHVGEYSADQLPTNTITSGHDFRNSGGYIFNEPEKFTIFNGDDGTIVDTTDYTPGRGTYDWGDSYGNRSERYLSGTAYLNGETPFAVFCRGYYTRTALTAYYLADTNADGIGDKIETYWAFDTVNEANGKSLEAQGNHSLSVYDIDGDGKDEIIYGALVIDDDGTVEYSTGLGHGDAQHTSDWVSWNDGLEVMSVHEHADAKYHVEVRDAADGEILMGYYVGSDTGRGVMDDIDPTSEGAEWWSIASPDSSEFDDNNEPAWNSTKGEVFSSWSTMDNLIMLANQNPAANGTILWDGDLLAEIQDHTFDEGKYVPIGVVLYEWDYEKGTQERIFYSEEIYSNNGTKGNLGLVADFLGDWREEMIVRTSSDANKIRIYSTTIETDYVVPCLLEDLAYREGVAWQNVAYNQPINTSYLVSQGVVTAQLSEGDYSKFSKDTVALEFTPANDGDLYGLDITGYEIYRATGDGEYALIDTISTVADDDGGELEVLYAEDFEDGVHEFTVREDNAQGGLVEADRATVNPNTTKFFTVFGKRASDSKDDDRYLKTPKMEYSQENLVIESDFRLDAPTAKKSSNYYLLGAKNSTNEWVTADDEVILNIEALAGGSNGYYDSIKINGVDITATANVSNGASNGESGGYLTRDTTGWLHIVAKPDFTAKTIDVTLTRISTGDVVYEGTLDFVHNTCTKLEYIFCIGGKSYGAASIDNVVIGVEGAAAVAVAEEAPANFTYVDTGLASNTEYSYKVAAKVATLDGGSATSHMSLPITLMTSVDLVEAPVIDKVTLVQDTPVEEGGTVVDLLPATVKLVDATGTEIETYVDWDATGLDISTPGTYTIKASIKGWPEAVDVTVEVTENYFVEFEPVAVSTRIDVEPVMPETVTAVYANGTKQAKAVTWNLETVDISVAGEVQVQGTVEGIETPVICTLTVKPKPVFVKYTFGNQHLIVKAFDTSALAETAIGETGFKVSTSTTNWNNVSVNSYSEHEAGYYPYKSGLPDNGYYLFIGSGGNSSVGATLTLPITVPAGSEMKITFAKPSGTNNGGTDRGAANNTNTFTVGSEVINLQSDYAFNEWKTISVVSDTDVSAITFDLGKWSSVAIANIEIEDPNAVAAESVTLDKTELTLTEGETATLTATVAPETATDKTVTWSSDNEAVATVKDGVVTAVAEGTATITVTAANDLTVTCTITVQKKVVPATGVTLDKTEATVKIGDTVTLTATVAPEDATDKTLTWITSDEKIATVKDGVVTAVAEGTATITVTTANDKSATCTVIVKEVVDAESVTIDKTEATVKVGNTVTLTATVAPEDATDKTVTWTSSDETIATVADGVVTAVAEGTATITVTTANGKTATATITVEKKLEIGDVVEEWQKAPVQFVFDRGIMTGKGTLEDGTVKFDPNASLTREEFAQLLFAEEGKPETTTEKSFTDLVEGEWYVKAVLWAAEKEIVSGVGDGSRFGVAEPITREQLALMLYKYAGLKGYDTTGSAELDKFADANTASSWAVPSLKWAVANGVLSGAGDNLKPTNTATRAECAAMVRTFMDKFDK